MPLDPSLPPDLAAEIRDIRRRLRNLEQSPNLPFSSIKGGAFIFLDNDGNVRAARGNVNTAGVIQFPEGSSEGSTTAYGDQFYGDGGAIAFWLRKGDRGLAYPAMPIPIVKPTVDLVTSGTFITLWEGRVDFPAHEVVAVGGSVQSDAGTTGEIRLFENFSNAFTNVVSVPASHNGFYTFEWLHPRSCGLYDPRGTNPAGLFLQFQARRTGGAGNLTVFPPPRVELTSKFLHPNANTNGNPVLG